MHQPQQNEMSANHQHGTPTATGLKCDSPVELSNFKDDQSITMNTKPNFEKELENLSDRCDLNSLVVSSKKHAIDVRKETGSIVLGQIALKTRWIQCQKQSTVISQQKLERTLLFAWHVVLHVFTGGEQTVILSTNALERESSSQKCAAAWSLLDHSKQALQTCEESLEELAQSKTTILVDGDLDVGVFDLHVHMGVKGSERKPFMRTHPLSVNAAFDSVTQAYECSLHYAEDVFEPSTISGFRDVFEVVFAAAMNTPALPVCELEFVTPAQISKLEEWNYTDGEYDRTLRLNNLIEKAASQTPSKIAVVYKDRQITYQHLNEKANQLAHYLRLRLRIKTEQIVALFLSKSEDMITTVVSIWKSGAAYTPIDPTYPDARILFSLTDTGSKVILTDERNANRIREITSHMADLSVFTLEEIFSNFDDESNFPTHNPDFGLRSDQLAYLTYTSGTTGIPKGIKKRHTNVVNSITDISKRYDVIGRHENVVLFSPYVFEPFARQTLVALINSHTLVVVDDDQKLDPVAFEIILREQSITYLNGTASVLQEYDYSRCPHLKRLVLVGEDLTETRYKKLRTKFKNRVINEYGFTESAFVTAIKIFEPDSPRPNRSLGRPLRNVKCYVLNQHMKRLPPGAIGELYIGGQGIAEGYWNREDLTKGRFLPNPFQTVEERARGANSRIYRTGDLARWIPDSAEVEYIGRNDFQIKLRGVRIEPGEIESVLSTHPSVDRSVVVPKSAGAEGDGSPLSHLVGYWTGDDSTSESDLISFLDSKLPRYMIPSRLVHIDRVPTTINGKVDFRALPAVSLTPCSSEVTSVPQNAAEMHLRKIWSQLLSIPETSISTTDNFFRLGGNSITCIQLVGKVRQMMNGRLTVEQVFAQKTIRQLAPVIVAIESSVVGVPAMAISPESIGLSGNIEGVYPANSLQQGFMYHYLKNSGKDTAYSMQTVCTYHANMDAERYCQSWEYAKAQYSGLRVRFVSTTQIFQVVEKDTVLDYRFINLSDRPSHDQEQGFEALLTTDLSDPYRLDVGPLFRIYLVKFAENHYNLLFSCHHSILDGWSVPILLDRVHEIYVDHLEGQRTNDAVFHSAQLLSSSLSEDNLAYWRDQVETVTERCDLRGLVDDSVRYKIDLSSYDTIRQQKEKTINLGDLWTSSLKALCSKQGIMLHTVLQFVCHKVLNAYGHGKQSVVGTIVSGRDLPVDNIDQAVGLFINTLPLIVDHEQLRSATVHEALDTIQSRAIAMNMRSCVELAKLTPGKMTHELFDCLLVLENYPTVDIAKRQRLETALGLKVKGTSEKLTYPLVFACTETDDGVEVCVRYAAELFLDDTIDDILDVFKSLFGQVAGKMEAPVTSLEFLGELQISRLTKWNQSNVEYPQLTLSEMLEQAVAETPAKLALAYEDDTLTYTEFNAKANQLARYLRESLSLQPHTVVGLLLKKDISMFIAIFAIWKAGMAYTPIDPNVPGERVSYILKATSAVALLADESFIPRLHEISKTISVLPIHETVQRCQTLPTHNLNQVAVTTDLAYIYFTSGTTGNPKGVMIEHRGVVNLFCSLSKTFHLRDTPDEVLLSFSNYTFDHFVEQMTDALLSGQTLLILNDEMRADKDRLYDYMTKYRVTYLSGTPSVISMYDYERFPWLRRIDCVGEDFTEPVFEKIRHGFEGLIINGYGPTEVSITSHKRLYYKGERRANKSIGFQIDNSRTYVLNSDMKQVPIGAVGELYLGGDGVGRGYLNQPDVTAKKFPNNPYQTENDRANGRDGRLYKTGDLVRWLPTGEIEYLGREDFQIKLRGQRVELAEIEAAITSCSDMVKSVVVPRSRLIPGSLVEQKFLTGYFVAHTQRQEVEVKGELRKKLPEYLIPNRLIQIEAMPVTVSGKLDTKKLPEAEYATGETVERANNHTEEQLCVIWGALLGLPPSDVSVTADFFALGGDSLLSTKLSFVTTTQFARKVTVADIFKHRTIRATANFILTEAVPSGGKRWSENRSNISRASMAQERLLFIDQFLGGSNAYNVPKYVSIPLGTSILVLRQALAALIARHAALRTLLVPDSASGEITQRILSPDLLNDTLPIDEVQLKTSHELDQLLDGESRTRFNLSREIPIRIVLAKVNSPALLVCAFNFHHTAFDAWSWSIVQHDLRRLYMGLSSQSAEQVSFAAPSFSHGAYADWQRRLLEGEHGKALQNYWTTRLRGYSSVNLPTDYSRPHNFDHNGGDLSMTLDKTVLARIQAVSKSLQITPFSIFATTYFLLLRTYANQNDVTIGMPMANRIHAELESIVGCFMNMVALRLEIDPSTTLATLMQKTNHEIQHANLHQDLPFEELVRTLQVEQSPDRHPVFQHVFNCDIISSVADDTATSDDGTWQMQDFEPTSPIYSSSKFDLSTTVTARQGAVVVNFNWPTALFERETIAGFAATYERVLNQLASIDMLETPVSSLKLAEEYMQPGVTPTERLQSNDDAHSLGHLLDRHASIKPTATAIVCGDKTLTFEELHTQSNQMADFFRTVGLKDGDFLGLMLEPSLEMIVCIVAAWKLGVPYVPMDPKSTPAARLQHIVEDTELRVIFTQSKHGAQIRSAQPKGITVICLDDHIVQVQIADHSTDTVLSATRDSLAYCIYTSGTTGRPKGVLVPQHGVIRLAINLRDQYFGQQAEQSVLMVSNYVFDFSVEQFALSFLSGNRLVMLPNGITADDQFYEYLNRERLTYISGTPSVISKLDLSRLHYLQMVTTAGEQLHADQYLRLRTGFKGPLNNAYGTTETTVYNLVHSFAPNDQFINTLGSPLAGQEAFVANDSLQTLPTGAVGELFLSGDGVTAGYLKRPDLTKACFLPNTFSSNGQDSHGKTVYRTRDIVRRLRSGALEFRGRNDDQVKIRGFRIELGEVKAALAAYPSITSCEVLAMSREEEQSGRLDFLVGYYTSSLGPSTSEQIKSFMAERLPPALVPAHIVYVPGQLPTTVTGKLDVKALPKIETQEIKAKETDQCSPLEAKLCGIWSKLLGQSIGVNDDFFRHGGDSIKSLQLVREMAEQTSLRISVKDVFERRTIGELVRHAAQRMDKSPIEVLAEQGCLTGAVELLPVQKWFFDKTLSVENHWNQCFVIHTPHLEVPRLKTALLELQNYHDALRMSLRRTSFGVQQQYQSNVKAIQLHEIDTIQGGNVTSQLDQLQASLDIGAGRVGVAAYIHDPSTSNGTLWFAFHHLVVDTESWRIMSRDLQALYDGQELPSKSTSFRQWSSSLKMYKPLEREPQYWQDVLKSADCNLLPTSPDARHQSSFELSEADTRLITTTASFQLGFSAQDILLTAVGRAFYLHLHAPAIVTLEGHGRESNDGRFDLSRTVGWFTTMYPFLVPHTTSLRDNISQTSTALKMVPNKGLGFGALHGYRQLPGVTFNYLGHISGFGDSSTWTLESGMKQEWGRSRAAEDEHANESVLDITAWVEQNVLKLEFSGLVEPAVMKQLVDGLSAELDAVATLLLKEDRKTLDTPPPTEPSTPPEDFIPYFSFLESPRAGPILFLLPPGEGGAESYFNNVISTCSDVSIVAFNNIHLEHPQPDARFESLASKYISWMKESQPQGPYHLLGWSFGGVLSLEIANQLVRSGEKVSSLTLIDSYFNVRQVSAAIGCPEEKHILDPINWYYSPDKSDLARVVDTVDHLVLFKAGRSNERARFEAQEKMFAWYDSSRLNGLDALIPGDRVKNVELAGETHFSWVNNKAVLAQIASQIKLALEV